MVWMKSPTPTSNSFEINVLCKRRFTSSFTSRKFPTTRATWAGLAWPWALKLWLVRPLGFRMDDRRLRRAGLDYWQHLDWEAVDDWSALIDHFAGRRLWLFSKHAARAHTEAAFQPDNALVFGSESQGLPRGLLDEHTDRCLRIPMAAEARSLNLAVSVAVGVYEAVRQCAS